MIVVCIRFSNFWVWVKCLYHTSSDSGGIWGEFCLIFCTIYFCYLALSICLRFFVSQRFRSFCGGRFWMFPLSLEILGDGQRKSSCTHFLLMNTCVKSNAFVNCLAFFRVSGILSFFQGVIFSERKYRIVFVRSVQTATSICWGKLVSFVETLYVEWFIFDPSIILGTGICT